MRIEKLQIKEVGPFDSLDIKFAKCSKKDRAEIHILTGPNGCGKSTILYTLARPLSEDENNNLEVSKRFRKKNSFGIVKVHFEDGREAAYTYSSIHYTSIPETKVHPAFSYSGSRSITSHKLSAIQKLTINPFNQATSFFKEYDSASIVQWIANTKAKEALEYLSGRTSKKEKYMRVLRRIEKAIGDVIGVDFEFILETTQFSVLVNINNQLIELDVLPDGFKSILTWIGDLLMRMDLIPWEDDRDIFDRNFILFLDEVDIHLHPLWQRKILPMVQKLFPNAQIFVSTHSPFVVGSISDAWVYSFEVKNGKSYLKSIDESKAGSSYSLVLDEIFGIEELFDIETEAKFKAFYQLKDKILENDEGVMDDFLNLSRVLAEKGIETRDIVIRELRQLSRIIGKDLSI